MAISVVRDDNRVPAFMGTLNTDGVTPVAIKVNPVNHGLKISDGTSGSGHSYVNAQRDANRVPALWAVSSSDGKTPIPIYADSSGNLLVNSS